MQKAFVNDNINRSVTSNKEIKYIITLKPTTQDCNDIGITTETIVTITKDSYNFEGSAPEWYVVNVKPIIDEFISLIGSNPFNYSNQDLTTYRNNINILQQEQSNLKKVWNVLLYLKGKLSRLQKDEKERVMSIWDNLFTKYNVIISLFPTIFYHKANKILSQQYTFDEVQKELNSPNSYPNSLFADFVKLLDISTEEFQTAVKAGMQGNQSSLRSKINRKIDSNINNKFNGFYGAEKINLSAEFSNNLVSFNIQSEDGETMHLSERSNGLRWYLNMFINALSNNTNEKNVLYLFDEPGISLHLNAQKELLKLFVDLTNNENQLVYTTHSPHMLNMNDGGIHKIRAVDKDSQGYTRIFKTAYDSRIVPEHKMDTITPIVKAIGMDLSDNFGPARDKLNVICEGASDYIYLHTIANKLNSEIYKYNFIPSVGATNVFHLCNIFTGWTCPFIALFDFDKEGVEKGGEKIESCELYEIGKHFLYVKDITKEDIQSKKYKNNPFTIEDLIGRDVLKNFAINCGLGENSLSDNKVLLSKFYCEAIVSGQIEMSEECKDNFISLFNKINLAYK